VRVRRERALDDRDADKPERGRRARVCPSLTIGSRNDGWTTFGADTRAIHRAIRARVNIMRLVAGDAHGVDLLSTRIADEIVRFVQREA
jgi:hypothetical protein